MIDDECVLSNSRRITTAEIEDAIDFVLRACAEQDRVQYGTRAIRDGRAIALSHPDASLFGDVEDPIGMALRSELKVLGQILHDRLWKDNPSTSLLDRADDIAERHGDYGWRMGIMNYAFHGIGGWLA
jgi:hypothetical protein